MTEKITVISGDQRFIVTLWRLLKNIENICSNFRGKRSWIENTFILCYQFRKNTNLKNHTTVCIKHLTPVGVFRYIKRFLFSIFEGKWKNTEVDWATFCRPICSMPATFPYLTPGKQVCSTQWGKESGWHTGEIFLSQQAIYGARSRAERDPEADLSQYTVLLNTKITGYTVNTINDGWPDYNIKNTKEWVI